MQKSFREDAFDVLTEESAYWLGMLITDGCVSWPKNRPSPRIFLRQAERQRAHVERFRAFLGASNAIVAHVHKDPRGAERHTVCLQVTSRRLGEALTRYGVVPRKTGVAKAAEELVWMPSFWRGVIDGDGCVYGPRKFYYSGSEPLADQFIAFVRGFDGSFAPTKIRQPGCVVVYACGTIAEAVLRALYGGADLCLVEKKQRALAVA